MVKKVGPIAETYSDQLNDVEQLMEQNPDENLAENIYSKLSKEEILLKAKELVHTADTKKAALEYQGLLNAFDDLMDQERPSLIRQWVEDGNDARAFVSPKDEAKQELNSLLQAFKKRKNEERKRAEEEKIVNLKHKQSVLENIKILVESEETEKSLSTLREYMRQWREIRQIPKEYQNELHISYKFFIDKFYDQMSVFNELKDLDKDKNLELKIELIKRAEALKDEPNIRKALLQLNKYHEDWKNTGPVRNDISEDIWKRFKTSSDIVIQAKKEQQEKIDTNRQYNLEKKLILIEKGELAISVLPTQHKEWSKLSSALENLMDEWKKIGPVPSQNNEETWLRFKAIRNHFFGERKHFFKDVQNSKKDNLEKKTLLCLEAEKLKDSEEFIKTTAALQKLLEEWKKIGPVPEEQNNQIWHKFKAAFDHFYTRKNVWFKLKKTESSGSIEKKKAIIKSLEILNGSEAQNQQTLLNDLKLFQKQWNEAGYVSGKSYQQLNKTYQALTDEIFARYKSLNMANRSSGKGVQRNTFQSQSLPQKSTQDRKLQETISRLRDEILTMESNKSFFKHSKNTEAVTIQIDESISKVRAEIAKAEQELKLLKSSS